MPWCPAAMKPIQLHSLCAASPSTYFSLFQQISHHKISQIWVEVLHTS